MRRVRWMLGACVAVLVAGGLACGESTEPPRDGTATISLTTPQTDDGAVAVTLTGPGISNLTPANSSYRVFWRLVSQDELRAIVVGNVAAGPLFSVRVADVGNLSRYAGSVTQLATRADALRDDRSGYAVTVTSAEQAP